ncbi:MAG: zinc dependent phospholipase C family protein [Defluviitaleaceae bacterium]|nr:zinc dependent phospholipase C family protein [Defluviitaleaceae bacterium]
MPGFLSHYIAGKAALQGVSPQIQQIIRAEERLYNLGTQGPDIFFYYLPGQLRKRSRGIAQQMHQNGLGVFLGFMAKVAKDAADCDKDTIFSYIAGFLMHYALDCNAHPYVYARAFNKNAPKIKNSADHRKFETAIDVALLNLVEGKKLTGISQWELINAEKNRLTIAAAALSRGISEVYGRDVPPKIVCRAMQHMITLTRLLQSKNGRRKRFMELLENFTVREPIYSSMVPMESMAEADCLNPQKAEWTPPWDENDPHNESFMECYQTAVDEGIKMMETMYNYIYGNEDFYALVEILGNRSLKTGRTCGETA